MRKVTWEQVPGTESRILSSPEARSLFFVQSDTCSSRTFHGPAPFPHSVPITENYLLLHSQYVTTIRGQPVSVTRSRNQEPATSGPLGASAQVPRHLSNRPLYHFTLVFGKIFYLPPAPQPRHVSTGSQGPVWAAGFVNVEQSVRTEIMHLSDSLIRNLTSKKTSGMFDISALSCILIAENYLCGNRTQM